MPTIKECNFYGLKHDEVAKRFEGDLSYVGDMCLETGQTVAVYKAASPNKFKGHKKFMLLQIRTSGGGIVGGMDLKDIKKHSVHQAVLCTECNTVLYSVHRHHYHTCDCPNETFVDGGKDYLRAGAMSMEKVKTGTYDVLTKTWTETE